MIGIRMVWHLPQTPIAHPAQASQVVAQELRRGMEEATLLVQRNVQEHTPVGATGQTRGSIVSEIRGTPVLLTGIVTSPLGHIDPLEEGGRPHWAPIGPLLLWARRVLGDERAAYAVRWAIHLRGTRGAHMFQRGFEASIQGITRAFEAASTRIAARP
jgi:hypothetical protein